MSSIDRRLSAFTISAAVLTMCLPSSSFASGATSGQGSVVFQCQTGAKRILVTRIGPNLRYEFGPLGHPEMAIVATPTDGTVHQVRNQGPHYEFSQLRFTNNAYSYAVFSDWASPDYQGKGARDRSGLYVFKGRVKIATLVCKTGGEFADEFPFDRYPADSENFE